MNRSHGEGSISQRKSGCWQASLMVDGKRKTVYGKTRQEAQHKLAELRQQATATGALPDPGTRTVNDLLDRWLEAIGPGLKPATKEQYRIILDCHARPTLGSIKLAKVTPDRLQTVYTGLQGEGKGRTAQLLHFLLHKAFGLALAWRWLPENPCNRVVRPTHKAERKEMWSPWQLHAFLQGTEGHWLQPLYVAALASGCRLGELLGLTWQDVNLTIGTVNVNKSLQRVGGRWLASTPKTKSGARKVAVPPAGVAALETQQKQQAIWRVEAGAGWQEIGLVFSNKQGEPLHRATVDHAISRECRRLSLPAMTPHGLRHMHASLLLAEGVSVPAVSRHLGHAHSGVTLAVYAHALGQGDQEAAEAIGRALSNK